MISQSAVMNTLTFLLPRFGLVLLFAALNVGNTFAEERVLTLPMESVGVVTLSNMPREIGPDLRFDENCIEVRQAQGNVTFTDEGLIGLEVATKASSDLSFLNELPSNVLGSLKLTSARLGKIQLQQIVRLKSLIKLELKDCEFAPDAFDGIGVMPELLHLDISQRTNVVEQGLAVSSWIVSHPKLRFVQARPSFSLADLRIVSEQKTLRYIFVTLGSDAKEVFECLAKLPQLQHLSFRVNDDVDQDALKEIGNLRQLRSLRWVYGRVDGDVLKRIAKHDQLEQLTLFQIEPGEGFGPALESLTRLKELTLHLSDKSKLKGLANHLLRMPHLSHWPELEKVNADALERITSSKHIESLTIQDVADDVTPEHLKRLGEMRSLKRLDLQGIPVGDEWLSSLADLTQLESLKLWDTNVTGRGFTGLKLPALSEVHLWFGAVDDEWIRPELSALKLLTALKSVQIGGSHFQPKDLEPLRDCQSIIDLRLWGGGFADDSTADLIAELPNLQQLSLEDNCIVTDKGAVALSSHGKLQRIWVGGFINYDSATALVRMPSLRSIVISSSKLSQEYEKELRQLSNVPSIFFSPFGGSVVIGADGRVRKEEPGERLSVKGKDGLQRRKSDDSTLRERMDQLEGKSAATLDPLLENTDFANQLTRLRGKVVILDFWGTWCGPCRMQIGKLKQLFTKYHEQGLEIIGVHTESGAEELEEFVKKRGVPWLNIVDSEDEIGNVFQVPHYPSLYLIDRAGILRVALVHPLGLEQAIVSLLEQSEYKK